jgi:hypothetical protein
MRMSTKEADSAKGGSEEGLAAVALVLVPTLVYVRTQ